MHIEEIRDYALSLSDVTEGFPFGEDVLVCKAQEKMFLLVPLASDPLQFNVKCDPDNAEQLREQYPESVLPGYHMNKKHWNTIILNRAWMKKEIEGFIRDSYELVIPKRKTQKKS